MVVRMQMVSGVGGEVRIDADQKADSMGVRRVELQNKDSLDEKGEPEGVKMEGKEEGKKERERQKKERSWERWMTLLDTEEAKKHESVVVIVVVIVVVVVNMKVFYFFLLYYVL